MFAPGSGDTDLVDNKNATGISFKKRNGRIALMMGSKEIGGERILSSRISEMKSEITNSDKGHTITTMIGGKFKRHGVKSTFPKWFGETGFNSKKDFMKVLNSKKGVRYDRLVTRAISDLSKGYESSFGRISANRKFLVSSRQKFDNNGVVFRTINGRVVPMRGGVPF